MPPLAGRVELPGYIADDQREALFQRALVFVIPSHYEGFGMPVLEAMTVGVPVIAADRGALPEVVGDAGLLVPATDPGGFGVAMEHLLASPDRRNQLPNCGLVASGTVPMDGRGARRSRGVGPGDRRAAAWLIVR